MRLTTSIRNLLLVSAVLLVALPANAGVRFVRGGFGYGYGPSFGYGYGYGPYGYGGFVGYPRMYSRPTVGTIKLDTKAKNAEVYLNGSFAGTVGELKSLSLAQGSYDLEIRNTGHESYSQKIFVVNGKTIHIHP